MAVSSGAIGIIYWVFFVENLFKFSYELVRLERIILTVQTQDTEFDENGPTVVCIKWMKLT